MRKVTCASCGRPYDYDSDDFCPKCGSYNPPPDRAGARPAQAPPARVSAASKDRPRPAAQPKTPPVGPRTVSYGGPQGGTPWEEPPRTEAALPAQASGARARVAVPPLHCPALRVGSYA